VVEVVAQEVQVQPKSPLAVVVRVLATLLLVQRLPTVEMLEVVQAAQILAQVVDLVVATEHPVNLVALVLLSFVTLAHSAVRAVLLHHPAATQSTHLQPLERTQHNMATTRKPAVKKVPTRAPVKRPIIRRAKPVAKQDMTDKVLDLIKWVDNPFKLISVILLSTIFFLGYLTWDSRQVILAAISSSNTMPQLKTHDEILPIAKGLIKDVNAVGLVVNKVNLATNSRTTILAIANGERNHKLEGITVSLFNESPARNADVVSMLNNEIACKPFESSSPVGEWAKS